MFEEYSEVVSVDEMCEMLGVGKNNAYLLLQNESVKAYRNGRTWRIPKYSIMEYIVREAKLN